MFILFKQLEKEVIDCFALLDFSETELKELECEKNE